jgi:hypothetical protein
MSSFSESGLRLSVVIPSYNSSFWLPTTLTALNEALITANIVAEIIIVDDGSTDDTEGVLQEIASSLSFPLTLISQSNQGRFMARWAGAQAAQYPAMLLLDSRVLLEKSSLLYVAENGWIGQPAKGKTISWNGHAVTDANAPLIGHFWEVPTYVFWRKYLSRPRPTIISTTNFNSAPKGTTFFLCATTSFIDASQLFWPTENAALTNDDTKILRYLVETTRVRLDPGFSGIYRPRTNVKAFIRHTFDRGTTLVDGFAGVNATINLGLGVLALAPLVWISIFVLLLASGNSIAWLVFSGATVLLLLAPAFFGMLARCPAKGVLSYITYILIFLVPYWFGVIRGIKLHGKKLFTTRATPTAQVS